MMLIFNLNQTYFYIDTMMLTGAWKLGQTETEPTLITS